MKLTKPQFDENEIKMLQKCLDSGWVTQGPLTAQFEKTFAEKHAIKHALTTTSCTAALHLATMALGFKPGDEVIVPAFTWVTSAHSIEYVGAKVVFADVEYETFNLDPAALEAAITPRTKGVIVVHLFGLAAKMDEIMAIAKRHNLLVIEDAACAIGTVYNHQPVGGIGDIGCFSFHPRKIVTTGEGGMVTTNRDDIAGLVKSLRNHGSTTHLKGIAEKPRPYTMGAFDMLGYNLRLSDIQAAVGLAQMDKLDGLLRERKSLAENYNVILNDIEEIDLPFVPEKCEHTYQSYVIRVTKGGNTMRNKIMDHLAALNIETRPGTHAVHRLGYYSKKYGVQPENYPVACMCEDTTITLPLFPGMVEDDQKRVASCLKEAIKHG